jgi:hypothetical protein
VSLFFIIWLGIMVVMMSIACWGFFRMWQLDKEIKAKEREWQYGRRFDDR